jgi:hypothetical protein
MAEDIKPKEHAKLSPSATKRWMTCPGSIKLLEKLMEGKKVVRRTSKFAAEGTVAHEVHELCLTKNLNAEDYLGKKFKADGFEFTVTPNMVDAVQESIDYIDDRISCARLEINPDDLDYGVEVTTLVEVKAPLSYLGIPGLDGGTADVVLLFWTYNYNEPDQKMLYSVEVIDYKHGAGVVVEAYNNTQALHYALGVIMGPELKGKPIPGGIRITISQPRAFHKDGPIRWWDVDKDFILNWEKNELIPAARATLSEDAKLVASEEGCKFCDCAPCNAQYALVQEQAMIDFKEQAMPKLENLTVEQKIKIAKIIPTVRAFLVSVEKSIKLDIDAGSTDYVDDFKLVRGRANRVFTEEALDDDFSPIFDYLKYSEVFTEKRKSMTEIEKILKNAVGLRKANALMKEWTNKPAGALIVAPISDKRAAVEPSVSSEFDDLKSPKYKVGLTV